MVAPVLKSFQAEVRLKAHGISQTQFPPLSHLESPEEASSLWTFGRNFSAPFPLISQWCCAKSGFSVVFDESPVSDPKKCPSS